MTCGPMCMQLFIEAGEWLVVPGDFELACSECPRNKPEEQYGQQDFWGAAMYRDESHAVDDLIWTARDTWADAILEQWGRWSRSDSERIGYPSAQPFAIKAGGGIPVCDDLAERAEGALRRMDAGWRAVLKTKYFGRGYMAPKTHLKALREFVNAFEDM